MSPREIFSIKNKKDFERTAREVFRFQAENNPVYKKYLSQINCSPDSVKFAHQIPFLPVEFFKTNKVVTQSAIRIPKSVIFFSSGTGKMKRSRHYVSDAWFYEKSCGKCFELFYGNVKQYYILSLLPSYYENKRSSLLYMMNVLMKKSGRKENGFYSDKEPERIFHVIHRLLSEKKKVVLFGVSFALLNLAEQFFSSSKQKKTWNRNLTIIETGGMKGKREEITREELHRILCEKFGIKKIHSEYGMAELLSQAWSKGNGIFRCPPWMKVLIRDVNDPFQIMNGVSGVLNIIDLANIYSCSFIATQDLGKIYPDGSFEVLGRTDNSDLRGCSLLSLE